MNQPGPELGSFQPSELLESLFEVITYSIPVAAGGEMRISILSLIMAGIILLFTFWMSRLAQQFLAERVFRRVAVDPGLAYTTQRMLHYAILVLGAIWAIHIGVNIDFTGLAVVITALSVGIGLGLKELTSDVAAGFVLLFERPVRVGDRVKLPGDLDIEGNVVAIGLRTTMIITNDRLTVIVPNSKLTNEKYINWSYSNEPVRLHLPVGVAYGTDLEIAKRALIEAAEGVEKVLGQPGPSVRMLGFGESSIDLELLVWTREPVTHPQIRSDLYFGMERKLREAGVQIPFPQRDLHVRSMEGRLQ